MKVVYADLTSFVVPVYMVMFDSHWFFNVGHLEAIYCHSEHGCSS